MNKVKLGIVGCGSTTRCMYGPIFKYLENGKFVAASDIEEEHARWAQNMYQANEIYTDRDQMLDDANIDAVIVGTPVYSHLDDVIAIAESGKHVLCEKPMARTVAECDEMIQACEHNGVILMVAFMKRFNKCFLQAKQMIEKGDLGRVFQVRVDWSFLSHPGGWRDSLSTWGGIYQDHGSHAIDLCRWWLGEIETVSGEIDIIMKKREVEDRAVAMFRHHGGAVSLHHMTRISHKPIVELYEIMGTEGALQIEFKSTWSFTSTEPFQMTLFRDGKTTTDVTPYNQGNLDDELRSNAQYLMELSHFCDCVLNQLKPHTSGWDGRIAIEVINAVYLSSRNQKKVRIPLAKEVDLPSEFIRLQQE